MIFKLIKALICDRGATVSLVWRIGCRTAPSNRRMRVTPGATVQIEPRTEALLRIGALQDRLDLLELFQACIEELGFLHGQTGDAATGPRCAAARSWIGQGWSAPMR